MSTESLLPTPPDPAPELRAVPKPDGDGVVYALQDGWHTEQLAGARRMRRDHTFDDLASFAAWLLRHALNPETAEILMAEACVVAALTPARHNGDVVTCGLPFDPRFALWRDVLTKGSSTLSQTAFNALLRANYNDLPRQFADGLLAAVRDLTITRGSKRQIRLDDHGLISFMGSVNERTVSGTLPTHFPVTCPIFDGVKVPAPLDSPPALSLPPSAEVSVLGDGEPLPPPMMPAQYTIEVLLDLTEVANGDVAFQLSAPALPQILRRARRDAAAYLARLLGSRFLVGLGTMKLHDVPAGELAPTPIAVGWNTDGRGQAV